MTMHLPDTLLQGDDDDNDDNDGDDNDDNDDIQLK